MTGTQLSESTARILRPIRLVFAEEPRDAEDEGPLRIGPDEDKGKPEIVPDRDEVEYRYRRQGGPHQPDDYRHGRFSKDRPRP